MTHDEAAVALRTQATAAAAWPTGEEEEGENRYSGDILDEDFGGLHLLTKCNPLGIKLARFKVHR